MPSSSFNAYHFTKGHTLRDGSPLKSPGETHVFDGPVKICESGLHASRTAWQALPYAPGSTLSRVYCEDIVEERPNDKLVCRRRTVVATIDAEPLLRLFARRQALSVIDNWDAPSVVRQYLKTGDESLREAAESAARSAVQSTASWSITSWSSAQFASAASWLASRSTVSWSASAASWYAARSAAESAARDMFNTMIDEAFNSKGEY